jgi:cell division protein FtsN
MNDDKYTDEPMEFVNQEPVEPVSEEPIQKPTARPRSGTAPSNRGSNKLFAGVVAIAVIVAIALLWPRGADIDDNVSVLTSENQSVPEIDAPVSSDVDINEAVAEIIPETAEAKITKAKPTPKPEPIETVKTDKVVATSKPEAPGVEGSWGIQVFASGTKQGAEKYKAKMDAKGFRAVVRSGDDGNHRVWIGYFKSRDYAEAWKSANSKSIPNKTMVKQR